MSYTKCSTFLTTQFMRTSLDCQLKKHGIPKDLTAFKLNNQVFIQNKIRGTKSL